MKTMRRGALVKYVGSDELGRGKVFQVVHKCGSHISIYFPCRYLGGEIHRTLQDMPIKDFVLVR